MCRLLEMGVAVPFLDYWRQRCETRVRVEVSTLLLGAVPAQDSERWR